MELASRMREEIPWSAAQPSKFKCGIFIYQRPPPYVPPEGRLHYTPFRLPAGKGRVEVTHVGLAFEVTASPPDVLSTPIPAPVATPDAEGIKCL